MNRLLRSGTNDWKTGSLFTAPWILGFMLFFLWPFAASLYWSFCQFDLINPPEWVGIQNYKRLVGELGTSHGFSNALTNTVYFSLLSVPLSVALGVALALLLSTGIRGQSVYRTLIFLPSVIPVVAASVLWVWLLDPDDGMINYLLSWFAIPIQNWLNQSRSAISAAGISGLFSSADVYHGGRFLGAKDALVLMSVWGVGNFVVIYLAAIGEIPKSLHEAAEIDGANWWRKIRHVTIPMLSPVIFFNVVMGLIRSVQEFTSVYVLSEGIGEPGGSLTMISLQMFLSGFDDLELGYASAMAWLLFVLLVVATLLLFKTSKYWVHYRFAS